MEDDRLEPEMDLDALEEPPYLRRQKPVEVRRSRGRTLGRFKLPAAALGVLLVLAFAVYEVVQYGLHSERFLLRRERVEVAGTRFVSRAQVLEKFSSDIGRSVFSVPLEERRAMVEQVTWVESAQVARLWPNRIRVAVRERAPVAFLRTTAGLVMVDATGRLLDRPAQANFSFPMVIGISENDSGEDRRRRMELFMAVMRDMDREGTRYSLDLSEVDVADPEDARVVVVDTAILLHLGPGNFLERYKTYLAHIQEWRRKFSKIGSVDLRYDRQVVVNPEGR